MEKDREENVGNIEKTEETQKMEKKTGVEINKEGIYDKLYEDMPKEVVELLMKTHPLMDEKKAEQEIERYETRHSRRSEAEAIKQVRTQGGEESSHTSAKTESDIQAKHKTQGEAMLRAERRVTRVTEEEDIEDDIIQLVKHRSEPKKGLFVPEEPKKTRVPESVPRQQKGSERMEAQPRPRPSNSNTAKREEAVSEEKKKAVRKAVDPNRGKRELSAKLDMKQLEKEKTLDDFFNGTAGQNTLDDEEGSGIPGGRKIMVGVLAVFICLFGFLAFKTVSLSGELAKANETIATLEDLKDQNDKLKLEQLSMAEQIDDLTNANAVKNEGTGTPAGEGSNAEGTVPPDPNAAKEEFDTYTVVAGDSPWAISQKVYGNGAYVQKILDANGLKDGDNIKEGQTLKIPKL